MITRKIKETPKKKLPEQKLLTQKDNNGNWYNVVTEKVEYLNDLLKKGWRIVNFSNSISVGGAGSQYSKEWKEKERIVILIEKEVD